MNILEICQEVADIAAIQKPDSLFSRNSQHNASFLSVAKAELNSLMRYGDWQDLTKEGSFITTAGKSDYPIDEIVPDFYALIKDTIYIKDSSEKIIGAITPEQWMRDKYFFNSDTSVKFKIQSNCFKFLEEPPCGVKIVFQYRANSVCIDAKTREEKPTITKDTDIPIFDAYLVQLGILYRLLCKIGMSYDEEYNEYEKELRKKFGAALATKDIDLTGGRYNLPDVGIICDVKTVNQ